MAESYDNAPSGPKAWKRGAIQALPTRGLSVEVCAKYSYATTNDSSGEQIANYLKDGKVYAQHIRTNDKGRMPWIFKDGKVPVGLYGRWLWPDGGAGNQMLTICEGEIDTLSVAQAFDLKYPVVGVAGGEAIKQVKRDLEWIESFKTVVLCMDMDDAGNKYAEEIAKLLTPGKVKRMNLPLNDANDMIKANRSADLLKAFYSAPTMRPDGILSGDAITVEKIQAGLEARQGVDGPWKGINDKLRGHRRGEITIFVADTSTGKSTFLRSLGYHFMEQGLKIGSVFLEEGWTTTVTSFLALRYGVPTIDLLQNRALLSEEQWDEGVKWVRDRCAIWDHFGSADDDEILNKMRHMVVAEGVDFIIFDHLSIATSGRGASGDQRGIEQLMSKLAGFTESGIPAGIITACHIAKPHGRIALRKDDVRGSYSLAQLGHNLIALERDGQDEDQKHKTRLRVLKCRMTGDTGLAGTAVYDRDTGRLAWTPKTVTYACEKEGSSGEF